MRALIVTAMTLAACSSACAQSQTENAPAPLVRWAAPAAVEVVAHYQCAGKRIELEFEQHSGAVRITRYSGSAHLATESEIELWNGWLASLKMLTHYEFSCQAGDNEFVTFTGSASPYSPSVSVSVYWNSGVLRRVNAD